MEIATEMEAAICQLKTKIEDIISKMTADGYKRQFSLIVFDSTCEFCSCLPVSLTLCLPVNSPVLAWKAVVSDYDPAAFTSKFRSWLSSYQGNSLPLSNGAFSMDAIYHVPIHGLPSD